VPGTDIGVGINKFNNDYGCIVKVEVEAFEVLILVVFCMSGGG